MDTLLQVSADVRLSYNDMPLVNDSAFGPQILRLANRVHAELTSEFQLYLDSSDITLVAGTREYSISETYKVIFAANYYTSSTAAPIQLVETSIDYLDRENSGWRTTFRGVPYRWYETVTSAGAPAVGFDPIPATATSAGYPTVRLTVGVYTALTSSSTLPACLRDTDVYVAGLAYQWAKAKNKPDLANRKMLYDMEKDKLGTYLARKVRHNPNRMAPPISFGVGKV